MGTIDDPNQTVPRAELIAIIMAWGVIALDADVLDVTDHFNLEAGWRTGRRRALLSDLVD